MILDLSTLENGSSEFGFTIPPVKFTTDSSIPEIVRPVQCVVKVYRSGEQITIDGHFDAVLKIACSRCLELVEYSMKAGFTSDFRPAQSRSPVDENIELTPDELDIVWYDGNEIDITDQVRQNVVVNLPMQVLCKEDCRGLCVQCGANLNINPCKCNQEDNENPFQRLSGLRLS